MDDETRREIERLERQIKTLREYLHHLIDQSFERYQRAKDDTAAVSNRVAYIEGRTGIQLPENIWSPRKSMGGAPMPRRKSR